MNQIKLIKQLTKALHSTLDIIENVEKEVTKWESCCDVCEELSWNIKAILAGEE